MALMRNRPAAMMRRITAYSLAADVVVALLVGLVISHVVGLIVFIIGLIVSGLIYYNFSQVLKNRGVSRW